MKLSELKYGETASITGLSDQCRGEARRRLLDLGFVRGTIITVQNISPLGNPVAYSLRETLIALRTEQADQILIEKEDSENE
ncbi:FeoA family protein [Dysgonomonas capnocytophagoides]|uniref:FeoA family protein n=1 Tax=Dysgonomonas capnocytophagoides TaxID=45254 RepID=UPI00333F08CB